MRGIRGAICASGNTRDAIYTATQALLMEIERRNELVAADVVAAFFTMTPDLDADFPAYAARDMGWTAVPMLGAQESRVPGAPERSIRVLVLAHGDAPPRHVYLGRAAAMRPDLAEPGDESWAGASQPAPRGVEGERMERLLVVGLGLVGGSLAAAARRSGLFECVRGYDVDASAAELAVARGLVDGAGADLGSELGRSDVVVLAVPVSEILALLPRVGASVRPGTLVTDVGSTKRGIVRAMGELPGAVKAVGGHPMTGSTASGPAAATADLFGGARWVLTATARTDDAALRRLTRIVRAAGAQPVVMSAELHDRVVAITSHLPAVMAVGLVEMVGDLIDDVGGDAFLAGPGLRSASRLAGGDALMTAQMLSHNADNLRVAIDSLIERLRHLRDAVGGDPAGLRETLVQAGATRGSLIEKLADADDAL